MIFRTIRYDSINILIILNVSFINWYMKLNASNRIEFGGEWIRNSLGWNSFSLFGHNGLLVTFEMVTTESVEHLPNPSTSF